MTSAWTTTVRPRLADTISRAGRWPLLPAALVAVIVGADLISRRVPFDILVTGLLDEPAHLSTAALVLLAVAGGHRLAAAPTVTLSAMAASVLIDVDHVPLYAGVPWVADIGGRPYTHSFATVVGLLAVWLLAGRRWPVVVGAAIGVCLHFVRDVATGPGLPLWWPLSSVDVRLPYRWYLIAVVALGLVATGRAVQRRRTHRA